MGVLTQKGGRQAIIWPDFSQQLHENEIIGSRRGVRPESPLNSGKSFLLLTLILLSISIFLAHLRNAARGNYGTLVFHFNASGEILNLCHIQLMAKVN